MKRKRSELLFDLIVTAFMLFSAAVCLYPILFVISMSVSDPIAAARMEVWLFPVGFSLEAYKLMLSNAMIWVYTYNTVFYTLVGAFVSVVMTVLLAYPLSRKTFFLRNQIMFLVTFTMFFSGGLIPSFILVSKLGLYNTRWAIILPSAISVFNTIIARTFFQSMPESLIESVKLDGGGELTVLLRIVIPLSMPIIAVLILYYAVAAWNSFFPALLYLKDAELHPMQLYLRRVLIQNTEDAGQDMKDAINKSFISMQLRYTIIVISTLPILVVYPFLQKYFVKGVMIGAIKE